MVLFGLFSQKLPGIKELGIGLLQTQAGFTFPLAVHINDRTLSPLDAIFGFIILDTLIACTTILLSTKEVLAARWLVYVASFLQMASFIVLGVGLVMLQKMVSPTTGCEKLIIIWIGRIEPFGQGVPFDLWLYFVWRVFSWLLNVIECFCLTEDYHQEEHLGSQTFSSTALSCFVEPLVCFVVAVIAVQVNLSALDLEATSAWSTMGQSGALNVAFCSFVRLVWLWFSERPWKTMNAGCTAAATPRRFRVLREFFKCTIFFRFVWGFTRQEWGDPLVIACLSLFCAWPAWTYVIWFAFSRRRRGLGRGNSVLSFRRRVDSALIM
jgi:hypothetical protein